MQKKKRHHYIPRFYLKRFSSDDEDKMIGLYNLNNNKFIHEAPIRNQAYKKFLYGQDDEVENALAAMEATIARFFHYWIEEKQLLPPPPESNGFELLKRFILYQAFRTPKSGSDIMDSLNKGMKVLIKEFEPQLAVKIEGGMLVHKNPVLLMLLQSIKHQHLLDFMECKFVVNLSRLPFITSDSPVIFYNQLMEKAGTYMGSTALVAKGLQLFYPIHPRLMICFFDPLVYEFGGGCQNCFGTESIASIHQLNGLQLINSEAQIFFSKSVSSDYISELLGDFNAFRSTAKKVNQIINQGKKKFYFTSSEDAHIDLNLDFFSLKVKPEGYSGQIAPLRHASLKGPSTNPNE